MNFKRYLKSRIYIYFRPLIYINQFFNKILNKKPDPNTISVFDIRVINVLKLHKHNAKKTNIAKYKRSSKVGTFSVVSPSSLRVLRNKHV